MSSTGEVLGTFAMYCRESRHPEPEEIRFIVECATLAALAVERFRNDETIRESRRSHNALLSNLPGAAYRCQNDDNWSMDFISDSVKSLCGYEAAEFIGRTLSWVTLVVPDDRRRVRQDVHQYSLRQRIPFKIEYSITHRDGAVRGIWEQGRGIYAGNGTLLAIEGFMADVTKENQSHADASFLRALVESSTDAILGTDLQGRIISANPAAVRLTGYSTKELIDSLVWGASVPEGWKKAHATVSRARVEGTTLNNVEVPVISKDGVLRDLSISFTPVREAGGNLIGWAITMRDQTEFNVTRAKLVQSERLAAVGQAISGIAHESRNALQRIQVGVDMLGFEFPEDVECRKDLDRISRAKEDLQHLFEDLRSYATPLTLEHSTSSIAHVWRQAWSNLESDRAGRDAQLIEQITGVSFQLASERNEEADRTLQAYATNLDCDVDAFRLEQVFRNLLENSLFACSDPVEITIRCHDTQIDRRPALAISVEDNGPGLTPDQRVNLFEAFYTTKQKRTGLGMTIAKRIVTAHFGTIAVGNSDSGGTCIELVLLRNFSTKHFADSGVVFHDGETTDRPAMELGNSTPFERSTATDVTNQGHVTGSDARVYEKAIQRWENEGGVIPSA